VTTLPVSTPDRLAFGPFEIEPETGRLYREGQLIPLAPKPFETLLYMARRPGRVVTKSELIDALWRDTFVTEDVLVQSMVEVRRALGDHAKTPRYVQTLPRRGYQFLESVRALHADEFAPGSQAPGQPTADAETPPAQATRVASVEEPAPAASAPDTLPSPEPPGFAQAGVTPQAQPALAQPRDGARARRRALAWLALVALLVASTGWALWRLRPAPVASAPEPPEPGALLVLPLEVDEPSPQSAWLRQGLAEMIQSQLGQTPGVHVVARHRLATALAEAGVSASEAASNAEGLVIARRLRAETLISGSFVRIDERFVLTTQSLDVASGHASTASVRGRYPQDLLGAVDDLCLRLASGLAGRGGLAPGGFRPVRLATRSLDASRHYVEALGWFARGGRRGAEEAEKRLDEALRLDASFAQAYLKKAEIQQWRRSWGYGNPDPAPAVQAAARLAHELPERERLLVESFAALLIDRDSTRALALQRALLRLYPTYAAEAGLPALMADTLHRQGDWDELITLGEAHVESASLPDGERAGLSALLARAFRRKGEFGRALEHARRAVRLWPSPNGPEYLWQRSQLGRIALEVGRRGDALAEFRAVAAANDAEARNLTDAAWGLYMAGESNEAGALVTRALSLDPAYGNAYHLRGWLQMAAGQYASAAASLESAFEKTPSAFGSPYQGMVDGDLAALYYAGVAYQKAGRAEQARAAFTRLIARCRKTVGAPEGAAGLAPSWQAANFLARASARLGQPVREPTRLLRDDTTYFVQSARLHAVQGQRQRALQELARGFDLGHGEQRHVRDDPDFDSLRDDPEFQRLVGASPRP
jgi:DNA-binding winged helix-turn-helix (wHTH) protein/tetratricopeptide (TPR) repeat protein/TolB-like protein